MEVVSIEFFKWLLSLSCVVPVCCKYIILLLFVRHWLLDFFRFVYIKVIIIHPSIHVYIYIGLFCYFASCVQWTTMSLSYLSYWICLQPSTQLRSLDIAVMTVFYYLFILLFCHAQWITSRINNDNKWVN